MRKLVEPRRCTQEWAATMIGVAQSTLRSWKDAPRNADGTYDVPMLVAWFVAKKLAEVESGSGDGATTDPNLSRMRLANAKIAEKNFERMCGELVRVEDVRVEVSRAADTLKRRLLGLPGSMAAHVQGRSVEDCAQVLEREIRDALGELCETLRVEEAEP